MSGALPPKPADNVRKGLAPLDPTLRPLDVATGLDASLGIKLRFGGDLREMIIPTRLNEGAA